MKIRSGIFLLYCIIITATTGFTMPSVFINPDMKVGYGYDGFLFDHEIDDKVTGYDQIFSCYVTIGSRGFSFGIGPVSQFANYEYEIWDKKKKYFSANYGTGCKLKGIVDNKILDFGIFTFICYGHNNVIFKKKGGFLLSGVGISFYPEFVKENNIGVTLDISNERIRTSQSVLMQQRIHVGIEYDYELIKGD